MDPTQRFSSRVENYARYRPGYPPEILDLLRQQCGLNSQQVIADIGSGTGILTELFLKNGNTVMGVEPNREMREAAERLLKQYPKFHSITGTAEATTLNEQSVDMIVAGQAFHWFKRQPARKEFVRILKPGGWVALIWNDRKTTSSPFLEAYERLLHTYSTDYAAVDHKQIDQQVIRSFFAPNEFRQHGFQNQQLLGWEGLQGRLMSSSYAPEAGHAKHEPMLKELRSIFDKYQMDDRVAFEYDTLIYYGQLG
ncbi:MAG: Methyltransferase [Pedosphaera sp.]|nr:Methyltransferase [Pedosphaera sp.]